LGVVLEEEVAYLLAVMPSSHLNVAVAMRPLAMLANHVGVVASDGVLLSRPGVARADRETTAARAQRTDTGVEVPGYVARQCNLGAAHRNASVAARRAAWCTAQARRSVLVPAHARTGSTGRVSGPIGASGSLRITVRAAACPDLWGARAGCGGSDELRVCRVAGASVGDQHLSDFAGVRGLGHKR
jgi:hypothetical protein